MADRTSSVIEAIEKKTEKQGDCLLWTGYHAGKYPELTKKNCHINVRNTLYEHHTGVKVIPGKYYLYSTCDTGVTCCNIKHMRLAETYPKNDKMKILSSLMNRTIIEEGGCLRYTSKYTNGGTSMTMLNKKTFFVYRVMFWAKSSYATMDDIPRINESGIAMQIAHNCGKYWCVNPDHLRLATIYENNDDDKAKHGTKVMGDKHSCSKYSDALVLEIFETKGTMTAQQRSERFEVPVAYVKQIDAGTVRRHVTGIKDTLERKLARSATAKKAREREWTTDMYDKAKLLIRQKSKDEQRHPTLGVCWIWNARLNKSGYGRIKIFGKDTNSHIVSCEAKYGRRLEKGEVTRHLCDVTSCSNPEHLEFGSQKMNCADRDKTGHRGNYKLNIEKAREIRIEKSNGMTTTALAMKYGHNRETIRNIINMKTYVE